MAGSDSKCHIKEKSNFEGQPSKAIFLYSLYSYRFITNPKGQHLHGIP